ncbi:serine hydrolase domain-containing protein [Agromyces aerolatus]|uniref:serine hydrolase domain-containing protein n=1 Tax=Agromyces sp. LY-1074 TaxID=3074080 RepID=UPI00285C4411|nr:MULTISPECIES: serine hydrolase domain-containing protein [unclassified Agromyces]MDR5698997.1 serine hydrolase domain-containing protein [Agromyces sp. LY-1074]MDR5705225.1 serine hydrolase domain-containing protein [Agromyces sp. LY-1358]
MAGIEHASSLLSETFTDRLAQHGVPGAAIAVLVGDEIFDLAAGVLSTSTKVEATTDSVFQIGSITKVWTATLIMQLVDEGLLDLDAPVRTVLPEFRLADDASAGRITPRQLLSHQAGFEGDIFTDTGKGDDALAKFVESIANLTQLFEPGELFSYNNVGYCVLGRIVEVLRGTTWRQALIERVAVPLGLTHVAPSADEAILHRAAVGHVGPGPDGVQIPAPIWALTRSNEPAGSMLSMRARDLVGFAKLHLNGGLADDGTRVLSEASVHAMRQPEVRVPRLSLMGPAWGLGWSFATDQSPVVIGHDGGTIGQSAFLRVCPELGVAVALLTNGGNAVGLFEDVVGSVFAELTGVDLPRLPSPHANPPEVDLAPLVGSYADALVDLTVEQDPDDRIWVRREPKGVLAAMGDQPSRDELAPYGPDSLIQLEAKQGVHTIYTFVGDRGDGRRRYIHYSRAVGRVDP